MQYFENPEHMPLAQVKDDIDRIFANIDYAGLLYLFGGESFLYGKLPDVIDYAKKYKGQYGRQAIITNGTVVPAKAVLEAMRDAGTLIEVSDYGDRSRNLIKLTESLSAYGIPFVVNKIKWYDYQQLVNGSARDAKTVFENCKENCICVRAGKLYRCPFLVHGDSLRAFPRDKRNYIAIDREGQSKDGLRDYLLGECAPPGCAFCSGYDVGHMAGVPTAIQAAKPLPYQRYF
jgi:hypothetical protein